MGEAYVVAPASDQSIETRAAGSDPIEKAKQSSRISADSRGNSLMTFAPAKKNVRIYNHEPNAQQLGNALVIPIKRAAISMGS